MSKHIIHYNLTTTTKEGGVESFVWDLAREQVRLGQRVTLVGGVGSVRRNLDGTAGQAAVRTVPFVDRQRFAIGPLQRAYALRKLAERLTMLPAALPLLRDADLVHVHKPYDLVLAPLLKRRGVPLIYHGHGEDFFRGDQRLMRSAAALLSCSAYNARTLRERYGRDPVVVYNGVDTTHFRPDVTHLRHQLASNAQTVLLLPGRMMPWKGQRYAIEALRLLNDPRLHLVVVGDGEVRADLEAQTHAAGLLGQVTFTGVVPHQHMPQYLASADIVIGTSYASETFGMLLAEALACERAVVASSWQGYDDVVFDDQTGARFQSQDSADLARVLRSLIDDPARRQRYARAGHQRVEDFFTWAAIARRVQAVYEQVWQ